MAKTQRGYQPRPERVAIETYDGHYIIAGTTSSEDGDVTHNTYDYDFWIVKLDSVGNILWNRVYNEMDDRVMALTPTLDSGFAIVAGVENGSMSTWIIKFDKDGNYIWDKELGYGGTDKGASPRAIHQTEDTGFILAGIHLMAGGNLDFWIAKTDTGGNKEWERT